MWSVVSRSLRPHGLYVAHQLFYPWDSPSKITGCSCPFLLQGIFLTQGSNLSFLRAPLLAGGFFTTEPPGKCLNMTKIYSSLTKSTVGRGNLPGSSSPCDSSVFSAPLTSRLLYLDIGFHGRKRKSAEDTCTIHQCFSI